MSKYGEEEKVADGYIIKGNSLYKGQQMLIDKIDNYSIEKICELFNLEEQNEAESYLFSFSKDFYNIKGMLMNLPFNKEDGDKYWKEFLLSPILDELVSHFYIDKDHNFKEDKIIELFQNNSYYFPNLNSDFTSISHKEILMMFFSSRNIYVNDPNLYNSKFRKMVNKAFNKVDIQHEWGNSISAFLFFDSTIEYFDKPKRAFKLSKEGGKVVEYLLYGRIIEELNAKEAIYILNSNNYNNKNLNDFLSDFMNLKSKKLIDVFKDVMKNKNIEKCILDAYEEYTKKDEIFKSNIECFSFKAKGKALNTIDYENFTIKCKRRKHFKHSDFTDKPNPKYKTIYQK